MGENFIGKGRKCSVGVDGFVLFDFSKWIWAYAVVFGRGHYGNIFWCLEAVGVQGG